MANFPEFDHPLRQHLSPLLATQARRRMAVVAASTVLFSLFSAGFETIVPLWVTQDLGYTAAQWAALRSLRFWGVFLGVIVLGALSDRFGQRLLGALCMLGAAGALIAFWINGKAVIWILMPCYGTLMSTAFVNMNTLTQAISQRRQGMANTIYRAAGAGASIVAPAAATWLGASFGGYPPVFGVFAALLVAAAVVLLRYPGETTPPALGHWRDEVTRLGRGYLTALRQRPLMAFIWLSLIWGSLLGGVGAFFAIYFTDPAYHIAQSDETYGQLLSLTGILTLAATLVAGFYLDRWSLRTMHLVIGLLAGLCSIVLGVTTSLPALVAAYAVFIIVTNMLIGPSSMWVSRAAGAGTQTAAFSIHKVVAAFTVALAMGGLGYLEHFGVSIRAIFLWGGILGVVSALGFLWLPEPPQPGVRPR